MLCPGHTRDPGKCSSVSVPNLCWPADQFHMHLESLTLTLPLPLTPSVMCGSIMCGSIMWCMYARNRPAHWALTPGYGSMSILSMSDGVCGVSVSILLFFVSVLVSVGCRESIVWCRHGGCSGSGYDKQHMIVSQQSISIVFTTDNNCAFMGCCWQPIKYLFEGNGNYPQGLL